MTKVVGEKEIMRNLNKRIKQIEGDIFNGMSAAMEFIKGEALEITPADKGVLRGSIFSNVARKVKGITAVVGFTAKYAPRVHEMPENTNWSTPGTGPKFLERAVANNQQAIIKIIEKRARLEK